METWRALAISGGLAAMLATGSIVAAQPPSLGEQQGRLARADRLSKAAQARSAELERRAASERDQAAQARAREAAAAERIKATEADILAARARIGIVDRLLEAQRTQVAERQGPIMRLIAALQSMARRPAALGLVQPGSTEDMVHVRAVLGTVMPVVEARTADVRGELNRIRALRNQAQNAVAALNSGRAKLEEQRVGLVRLEAEHRARAQQFDRSAMVESDRAIALGESARDLVDQMESLGEAVELGAELRALPGPLPRPPQPGDVAAVSSQRGAPYKLPLAGRIVTGFGELSATGVRARGLTLAVAPGAEAASPANGRVVFARRFRDYGGIVILDHGRGWTTLITGLDEPPVKRGDSVKQGSVIGRVPQAEAPRITVELRRRGQPVDLARLLGTN